METLYIAGGIGVAIGGALAIDAYAKRNTPGQAGVSLASQAAGAITRAVGVRQGDTPSVRTGLPIIVGDRPQDAPSPSQNNLNAIAVMAATVFGVGLNSGKVVATFASIETQGGRSLSNNCHNCALFNIHWTPGCGYPSFAHDNSLVIAFNVGRGSQVDGYWECLRHFKGFLERRSPAAIAAIRNADMNAFQVAIGQANYSPGYTNSIQGNSIRDGYSMMNPRFSRLVQAGLLVGNTA